MKCEVIFAFGRLVATRGVAELMDKDDEFKSFVRRSLSRYTQQDWGDTAAEDKAMNDAAFKSGNERILAAYDNEQHEDWKIWIITEWDHSATTILFPHEY